MYCRSRKGAWIEMSIIGGALSNSAVAPVRERGLKYNYQHRYQWAMEVAPVRERGLKSRLKNLKSRNMRSLP